MKWAKVEMEDSKSSYMIFVTRHAQERFEQRFYNGDNPYSMILALFRKSKGVSAFLNNPGLLQHFYDKYGYDRKHFFVYKKRVLFVCHKSDNKINILTCMRSPFWANGPQKFREIHKKNKFQGYEIESVA